MDHHRTALGQLNLADEVAQRFRSTNSRAVALDAILRVGAALTHAILATAIELSRFHDDGDSLHNTHK